MMKDDKGILPGVPKDSVLEARMLYGGRAWAARVLQ